MKNKLKLNQLCYLLRTILLILLVLLASQTLGYAALPGKIPVIRIHIPDTAASAKPTALQIGLETGQQVKALFPDIERRYDAWLATLFSRSEREVIFRQQLPLLIRQLDAETNAELQGISSAWALSATTQAGDGQLSQAEYYLLNLLPDLGMMPNGVGFGVYGAAAADGQPIVGRNLDWASPSEFAELQALQVLTVYETPYENTPYRMVTIGFAGLLTLFSGFNEHGLFISLLNAEPYTPHSPFNRLKTIASSSSFSWRQALASQTTVTGATNRLMKQSYTFNHSVLLADREIIQVLEQSPRTHKQAIRHWHSALNTGKTWSHPQQIAAVNCLLLVEMNDPCSAASNTVRWQRLNTLASQSSKEPINPLAPLGPLKKADKQTVAQVLFDRANRGYELFNADTLHSFYYLPASNHLYLYANTKAPSTRQALPLHQPYLTLLPVAKAESFPLTGLIWALLALKLATMYWLHRRYKQRTLKITSLTLRTTE